MVYVNIASGVRMVVDGVVLCGATAVNLEKVDM